MDEESVNLIRLANEAAKKAYAPYSNFRVGAALLCADGSIFTGCNVENRSYGLTNCAERTALYKAVSEGHTDYRAIAIVSPDAQDPLPPCGACRQVLSEFSSDLKIYYADKEGNCVESSIEHLYPADSLHHLGKSQ